MHKIAIAGAHGVGKTTLASALSSRMGLPMITEVARSVAQKYGFSSTEEIRRAEPHRKMLYQMSVFYHQIAAEDARCHGFISDRSVFDAAAYSYLYGLNNVAACLTDMAAYYSENYNFIVYCPLPDQSTDPDLLNDGFRLVDQDSQVQINEILFSLILKRARCAVVILPPDRSRWVNYVLKLNDLI